MSKSKKTTATYSDFWNWFQKQEKKFHKVIEGRDDIEDGFFAKISPKLKQIHDGIFFVAGMYDDDTAELILTAEGTIANIYLVEELIAAAPALDGWRFTALKPAMETADFEISMGDYVFNKNNISFYSTEDDNYPDEINIVLVYENFKASEKRSLSNGVFIFIDNLIGELNFFSIIDSLDVTSPSKAKEKLIPIEKLKDYLIWRQKEFVEKYDGVRHDTEEDEYVGLEGELEDGTALIAVVNTDLLQWDAKASHPWMTVVSILYDGSENGGMPNNEVFETAEDFEDEVFEQLKDADGYLNLGRQTGSNAREIYIACKDFRKPPKVLAEIVRKYEGKLDINFEIYKDKYWRTMNRFSRV